MDKDDVTEGMNDLEIVNYYNDKIHKNIILCRIRLLIYIVFFLIYFILVSNNHEVNNYRPIFHLLIGSFAIWWLITYMNRNSYIKKMILASKNNSFILCEECRKYKYSDSRCDTCGNSKTLSEEEKNELLKKYRKSKDIIAMIRKILTIFIIVVEFIIILICLDGPNSIETNFSTIYFFNLLFYGFALFVSIILTCGLLFLVVNSSSYFIEKYIIKIELLDDNSK